MAYTYATLLDDVVANMEEDSSEFLDALPAIIVRAQNYLQRRTDTPNINRFTEISVAASARELTLPADLLVLKSIQISTSAGIKDLTQQTNEYLIAYWPEFTSVGLPKYYAPKNNLEIFLAPTPAADNSAYIEYVPQVTLLTSALPTNWFSTYADSAFFAASMYYANLWTKNGEASQRWKADADEAIQILNNEGRRARRSDSVDRSRGSPENNLSDGST